VNLGTIITRSARYWPDHIAVADSQTRVSYAQLERRSNRLASGLVSLGVAVGEHVAILAANRVELVEAEVALYKAAMVKVPINARLSLDEVVRVLEDSCSVALITDASFAQALATRRAELPLLRQLIVLEGEGGDLGYAALLERGSEAALGLDPADDALAVLHYTSGSSGVLKAAMLSFGNRKALVRKSIASPTRRSGPGDVMAHVGPITHASGMQIMPLA